MTEVVDDVGEDEGAHQPHDRLAGIHLLGKGGGLLGDLVVVGDHVGLGGHVPQLNELVLAGLGEEHDQDEGDGQHGEQDHVGRVVAGLQDGHGVAHDPGVGAALGGQVGVQGGGGPETLAQDHAGIAAGHHHGEVEALDPLGQLHGQDVGDDGAEGVVNHGGDVAEDHHQDDGGVAVVDVVGHGVEQPGDLGAAGAGSAYADHDAHLEGQGELAAQAAPPCLEELHGALADEEGQHKDDDHQDDAEYKGIRDDLLGGKIELFADAPQRSSFQSLGLGLLGHGIASFLSCFNHCSKAGWEVFRENGG